MVDAQRDTEFNQNYLHLNRHFDYIWTNNRLNFVNVRTFNHVYSNNINILFSKVYIIIKVQ